MQNVQTRRRFLGTLAVAGAAAILPSSLAEAAEGPPETTSVRFIKAPVICIAPQYAAAELLRDEGFTEVGYVPAGTGDEVVKAFAEGSVDFTLALGINHIQVIDSGAPITFLAGVHVGCYELFARTGIQTIRELKGKSVGLAAASPALLRLMSLEVGIDPDRDIRWVTGPKIKPLDQFAEGKLDAFLGFPPEPQELRARGVGRVILSTALDRPWSQYFCCLLAGNSEYVRKYPVATKRVVRAILKATDLCVTDPAWVARKLVDGGFTPRYDYALQTLRDVPYSLWRQDYDAEDTVRFYALRMREAGMIRSTPQKIIAENTDWRFFNELKRELKT
jgi:NitT/TauT family transport system substrate-binding protein